MKPIIDQLKNETKSILSGLGLKAKFGNVIGLDLGTRYFRAVRVKGNAKDIPLKDILINETNGLKDLRVQMAIDPDEGICINLRKNAVTIKRASMPPMPTEEIEEALRWELKDELHLDIDKARIKFSVLREREEEDETKKIDLIAVVYNEKDIEPEVKELKGFGLNVQSVIPTEFALVAYVNHLNLTQSSEPIAIVDIGSVATTISIVEGKKLSFSRNVAIGGDNITEAMTGVLVSDKGKIELSREEAEKIKQEQGISEDIRIVSMIRPVLERLITQIKRSLDYYEHQFGSDPVKKLILAGNGARLKGLKEYISREISVEVWDTLPETAVAVGLVLASESGLDMLPEKFKEEKKKVLKKISIRMICILFSFLFLISYGFLSVKSINLKREIRIHRAHFDTVQDIRLIKDKMIMFSSIINTISSETINTGEVMRELSNTIASFVILDRLVIKDTLPNIKMTGVILREAELSEFMSGLESSPLFEKVKLVFSEKNEDYSTGALDFEIECSVTRQTREYKI